MSGLRLLIVGCGSIGRRHAANGAALNGPNNTAVCDLDTARAADVAGVSGTRMFPDLETALAWPPDAVVVASPHRSHVPIAAAALRAGAAVLVEKPISDDLLAAAGLVRLARELGRPLHTVCNMRYHPAVAALRASLAAVGAVRFARAHYGNYLPGMRDGGDYRGLYCARQDEGGGVVLDAIHEIDYLTWLLGPVTDVTAETGRISDLDIDVEDYAAVLLRHAGGARSEIHLDYLQRFKRRGCEIAGAAGTLLWESLGKRPEVCTVRLFRAGGGGSETLFADPDLDGNTPFRLMLSAFLASAGGDVTDLHTGAEAVRALEVACAARNSGEEGRRLALSPLIEIPA